MNIRTSADEIVLNTRTIRLAGIENVCTLKIEKVGQSVNFGDEGFTFDEPLCPVWLNAALTLFSLCLVVV